MLSDLPLPNHTWAEVTHCGGSAFETKGGRWAASALVTFLDEFLNRIFAPVLQATHRCVAAQKNATSENRPQLDPSVSPGFPLASFSKHTLHLLL